MKHIVVRAFSNNIHISNDYNVRSMDRNVEILPERISFNIVDVASTDTWIAAENAEQMLYESTHGSEMFTDRSDDF